MAATPTTTAEPAPPAAPAAPATPPRGPSPRERRVARTRRAIIDAARQLIDEQGYVETTVDQIADKADIAPRTFFRYFPSKEALVFADFADLRKELWRLLEDRPVDEHPLRSLLVALKAFAEITDEHHDRLSWGFRIAAEHPCLGDYELKAIKAETAGRIGTFVAQRLGVDIETDPRPDAWTVLAMSLFANAARITMRADDDARRRPELRDAFLALVDETVTTLQEVSGDL